MWKVELGSYEIRYLAEIFKHSIEDASSSFLLIVKMWNESHKLKKLLSKKEHELEILENPQFIHSTKHVKVCSEYNTKDVVEQSLDKEATMNMNWAFQPKPGMEVGLYYWTILFCTKRSRDTMEKKKSFWIFIGWVNRAVWLWRSIILQEDKNDREFIFIVKAVFLVSKGGVTASISPVWDAADWSLAGKAAT